MSCSAILTLPQNVDKHAQCEPGRLAIRFLDQTLSYAELSVQSNQLANALAARGVCRGDRVGIYMEKSLRTPVAMHGIMKAGAAYVPLDPGAPPERIAAMINDCGIGHLLCSDARSRALARLRASVAARLCVWGVQSGKSAGYENVSWAEIESADGAAAPAVRMSGADVAYIIYTSGSTGQPKGIVHTHDSSHAFSRWAAAEYGLASSDLLSNHAPLHFDLSILDYFSGAVAGCGTSIIPEEFTKLPSSYAALIAAQRMTVLYTVPFALVQLLLRGNLGAHDFGSLRWVIFGGEPMSTKHLCALMKIWPQARFDNMYGPAEVNGVSHYEVPALDGDETSIPIGPLGSHVEGLIVDDADAEVVPGDVGELLVRTPSMMSGYWARPQLNALAFHRRGQPPDAVDVFYRTGDLVRADEAAVLHFLGRKDRQVKVRGYRIELDEVEAILAQHPAVEEAAAVTGVDNSGALSIEAAVTFKDRACVVTPQDLTSHCRTLLPGYAVPGRITPLPTFARTTTGKIDRRALRDRLVLIHSAAAETE